MKNMKDGQAINLTENRAVAHTALRCPKNSSVIINGSNVIPDIHHVLDNIKVFSEKVRTGEWLGSTGKKLTNILSIGIGGSYLGPEFVFEALKCDKESMKQSEGRTLRFLANVDPVDVSRAIAGLDPETTLVVIVSKVRLYISISMTIDIINNLLIFILLFYYYSFN